MPFALGVELFIIFFSAICWFFFSPESTKVEQKMIITSPFSQVDAISEMSTDLWDEKPLLDESIVVLTELNSAVESTGSTIFKEVSIDVNSADTLGDEQQSISNNIDFSSVFIESENLELIQPLNPTQIKKVASALKKLSRIILQLEQIHDSKLVQRLVALPEAHPELETIMGDALHYTRELHLRIHQVIPDNADTSTALTESQNLEEMIQALSFTQARKVASALKELEIISKDTKLSGKGITQKYLVDLISANLFEHREAIADIISQVTEQVLA